MRNQATSVEHDLQILQGVSLSPKLLHLLTGIRPEIAQQTLSHYKPGIPFSVEALICGFVGGVLMSLLFNFLLMTPRLFEKKQTPVKRSITTLIEPSVMRAARVN